VNDDTIRDRIRTMLKTGVLQCDEESGRLWAGHGSGKRCAGCAELIAPAEVEYEAELSGQALRFHFRCYRIWLEECEPDPTSGAAR
jgi:hypothetical protein